MGIIMYNGIQYTGAGGGGSDVTPNPEGSATDELTSIDIDGTVYEIASGSKVDANPSGTATDTLQKVGIDGVIYDIQGGGGSSGGMSAYTEVVLWSDNNGSISPSSVTLIDSLSNYDAIYIVQAASNTLTLMSSQIIPVSAIDTSGNGYFGVYDAGGNSYYYSVLSYIDDTHLLLNSWSSNNKVTFYKVVGIKYGGNLSPIIYSTEEREVGVWIDGKPLYQRTIHKTTAFSNNAWTPNFLGTAGSGIKIVDYNGYAVMRGTEQLYEYSYFRSTNEYFTVITTTDCDDLSMYLMFSTYYTLEIGYCTIWYTKDTDTAGSGSYNTLGVPNIHYSTDEQVIGTWTDGKPIYQKTITISSLNYTTTGVNKVVDTITNVDMVVELKGVLSNSAKTVRRMLPYVNPTNTEKTAQIYYDYNATNIIFNSSDTWPTAQLDVTIQYTKTTD